MSKIKTNRINVFKINSNFSLATFSNVNGYNKVFSDENSCLFIQKDKVSIPEWSKFISALSPSFSFENRSNSFIYFRVYKTSLYALTGGYGHKVIQDYIEDEFGLNVALRLIDNLSVSSLHQFSIKSQTRQIQRSVANYNPGVDNENYNKILKSISGKGRFLGKDFLIQGKSSIVLRTENDITKVDSVLDEIENILELEEKVDIFKSYKQVKDKSLISRLDFGLYRKLYKFYLGKGDSSTLYLDLPDAFKRFDYSKYRMLINRKNIEVNELDINEIKSRLYEEFQDGLSIKNILSLRINGISIEGVSDIYHNSSLDRLIVCESMLDNQYYIKLDGKWFRVLDNIIQFIDDKIKNISVERGYLPDWNVRDIENIILFNNSIGKKSYAEQVYNEKLTEDNNFKLLDRNLIQLGSHSKIELADLYDSSKNRFIHVKNTWGAQASYLFSQAFVSSALYANSKEFRDKCQERFEIQSSERKTIVIAMAIESKKINDFPLNMSYFAKLSLYNAVSNIRNNGYDVVLVPISII
ncbi:DUF6119 family protein [Haemophilus sp. 27098_8_127]|jgi:hypothetical protein|uniref:DUF6119 family protein n=1 Tax=Haemophilus sp. 27098_8_127 TaxID=3003684 RepID=UPI00352E79EB